MVRARLLLLVAGLLLAPSVAAQERPPMEAPDSTGFWTAAELDLLDRGLDAINATRADMGFQKRPIEDPFRLEVVNRALDDPLSVGREAQAWDDAARRGDAAALLDAAGTTLQHAPVTISPRGPAEPPGTPKGIPDAAWPAACDLVDAQ